ncbi:MAG: hypothetical protein ACFB21_16455 [Opitutales bacterium]
MNEYYIRQPDSEEARGPYDLGRIGDLIEAGKADVTTLYYDEDREDWLPLIDNPDFREILFPEKRRLGLRAREVVDRVNEDDEDEEEPVTVDEFLKHATGSSDETGNTSAREHQRATFASIGAMVLGFSMLFSAVYLLYPNYGFLQSLISESDWLGLALAPFVWVGVLDLFLALCCFLSATEVYPLLRFRVLAGAAYYAYIFWAWEEPFTLAASVIAGISMWVLSMATGVLPVVIGAAGSLGGMAALIYFSFFS